MAHVNLPCPWGRVYVPTVKITLCKGNREVSWREYMFPLWEVPASCEGECEIYGGISAAHPFCHPGWRKEVEKAEGTVVAGPILLDEGWVALVTAPRRCALPSWREINPAQG